MPPWWRKPRVYVHDRAAESARRRRWARPAHKLRTRPDTVRGRAEGGATHEQTKKTVTGSGRTGTQTTNTGNGHTPSKSACAAQAQGAPRAAAAGPTVRGPKRAPRTHRPGAKRHAGAANCTASKAGPNEHKLWAGAGTRPAPGVVKARAMLPTTPAPRELAAGCAMTGPAT